MVLGLGSSTIFKLNRLLIKKWRVILKKKKQFSNHWKQQLAIIKIHEYMCQRKVDVKKNESDSSNMLLQSVWHATNWKKITTPNGYINKVGSTVSMSC